MRSNNYCQTEPHWNINFIQFLIEIQALAPWRSVMNLKLKISKHIYFNVHVLQSSLVIVIWPFLQSTFDVKSTLSKVLAWCHEATSYHLSKSWLINKLTEKFVCQKQHIFSRPIEFSEFNLSKDLYFFQK